MPSVKGNLPLSHLGNVVPPGYHYYEKLVMPGKDLILPLVYLKWYDLYPEDAPITAEQAAACRAFLEKEITAGRLKLDGELGFSQGYTPHI